MDAKTAYRNTQTTRRVEIGAATVEYEISGERFPLLETFEDIRQMYIDIAEKTITEFFGTDQKKYQVSVDGKVGAALQTARLNGSGIEAYQVGGTDELKAAFNAAWAYLNLKAPVRTGYFKSSAGTSASGSFTIRVNGKEVSNINWDFVSAKSNIQIYSKARYASPLESIYRGGIFIAARQKAIAAGKGLVRASMSYRRAVEMGQVPMVGKNGKQFKPLSVPVLEMGTIQSNVTNFAGQVEWNLQRGRKRPDPNMIERRILKEDRWREKWNRPKR